MDTVVIDFFLLSDGCLETSAHVRKTFTHDAIKFFVIYVGHGAGGQGLDKFLGKSG